MMFATYKKEGTLRVFFETPCINVKLKESGCRGCRGRGLCVCGGGLHRSLSLLSTQSEGDKPTQKLQDFEFLKLDCSNFVGNFRRNLGKIQLRRGV